MSHDMSRQPFPRNTRAAIQTLLALAALGLSLQLAACNSSETHWHDDMFDASADTSGGDTSTADTSPSDVIADTSVQDTIDPDTSADTASDTSVSDTSEDASDTADTGDMVVPVPSVVVEDQTLARVDAVRVSEVVVDGPTWLAIVDPEAAPADAFIGLLLLDGTESTLTDVEVLLERDLTDGESLVAALYADLGEAMVFEPDDADTAVLDADGLPVSDTFVVSVAPPVLALAEAQTVALSTVLEVLDASTGGRGWLVVHGALQDGSLDTSSVLAAIPSAGQLADSLGSAEPLQVVLDAPLPDGVTTVHVVLYGEGGDVTVFEPGVDEPLDGGPPSIAVEVTVAEGTPAVRLSVSAADLSSGYTWLGEPAALAGVEDGVPGAALTLQSGWRYELVNPFVGAHPLELVDTMLDASLLSQSGDGVLEASPGIAWDESDGGTARFTLVEPLASALDGYRCVIHPGSMAGAVTVQGAIDNP